MRQEHVMHSGVPVGLSLVPAAFLAVLMLGAAGPQPPRKKVLTGADAVAAYPRVNVATGYEVDPSWPERRADMPWGSMPGITVDPKDQVWLFTRTNPPVQIYTSEGKFVRAWGQGDLEGAHYIRTDRQGNVWAADIRLHVVRKFTPEGELLLTIGVAGEAGEDETHLNMPTDMAIAPDGSIFISDGYGNARVAHFDKEGKFINAWGSLGTGPGQFSLSHSIVMDSRGRLYVADRNNVRIQVFDQKGALLNTWANILVPWGLWINDSDEIWACGSSPMQWGIDPKYPKAPLGCPPKDQVIMKFDTSGKVLQVWTFPKAEDGAEKPGELNWLHSVAMDSKGNIHVGDIMGKRAQKFTTKR